MVEGYLRYSKYLIPLLVLLVTAIHSNSFIGILKKRVLYPYLVLITYGTINLLINPSVDGFKNIFFIFVYCSPFLFFYCYFDEKFNRRIFYLLSTFFLIKVGFNYNTHFSLIDSQGIAEGTESFIFGFFFLYFFKLKDWRNALICLIFVILSLKRVVLFGCFICAVISIFEHRISDTLKQYSVLLIALFLLVFMFLFGLGTFDKLIYEWFHVSPNYLTMGRSELYKIVVYSSHDIKHLLFGNGAGSVHQVVQVATKGMEDNLHSDILKLGYEYGVVIYFTFFYLLSRMKMRGSLPFVMLILLAFSTDNILIYPQVMFFCIYFIIVVNNYELSKK